MTAQLTEQTTARTGVGQKFRFFTESVSAFKRTAADGSEEMVIAGIASSNRRDRYGDTMSAQCQTSLLSQSKKLTMFGNHDYNVPEDVYGACGESHLETEGDILKLAIEMVVAQSNPRAIKAWELINKDGVRLAFSIGGIITDAEIDEDNDDGSSWWPPLIINDLELLEISLVGVPANRDSYTRSFLEDIKKSAFKAATRDPGVQKAFLRSIGVKSIDDSFADLRDAETVNAEIAANGVMLEKDGTNDDGTKTAAFCKHDPVCASYDEHVEKEPPADDEVPDEQCSHNGCDKPRAGDRELCAEHAADHTNAVLADVDALVVKAQAELDTLRSTTDAATKELSALNADIATKKTEVETLTKQRDDLQAQVVKLKATPTGRQSHATSGGSSNINPADLAKMTTDELREYRRKVNAAPGNDARPLGATDGDDPT